MNVVLNQQPLQLPANATVQDLLAAIDARPPFAVAVNTGFVPKAQYATWALHEGDQIEVIAPVTGG
ncbi:sulfur carrier protein ThiS [Comamonas faecalis]|uniref:Sulfur carrier protein ThiS n=1 Tax=Comamonas faecalis TaxID=1387849 RepID=A0ABP7QGL4_9BURK